MSSDKSVTARARVERRQRSAGLSIAQLHGEHLPDHLDPFLAFDHFVMAEPFFPPHPHAGFSAVTYMFPQSENGFVNRDSRGERIEIHPGDLHWTGAGRGIMHEEIPITRGVACHGLQIFVNLHSSKKRMAPEILHLDASSVPRVTKDGHDVRVVLGRHGEITSPLAPPTAVTLLDIVLAPGAPFVHPSPGDESRFIYVIDGAVDVGPPAGIVRLTTSDAAGLSDVGTQTTLRAGDRGAHVVIAGGTPLREPVVFYGPFCMNSREDALRAQHDFEAGKMGRLARSF